MRDGTERSPVRLSQGSRQVWFSVAGAFNNREGCLSLRHPVWVTVGHYRSLEEGAGLQFVQTLQEEY